MDPETLLLEKAQFISKWDVSKAKHAIFIDESGNHDTGNIDPNWPILSLFGVIIRFDTYIKLKKKIFDLKCYLWPPQGKFGYNHKNETVVKQVCFHSSDMRRKEGPFSKNILSNDDRQYMDNVLWNDIISKYPWIGLSCIIDKQKLCNQYRYPVNPYFIAVTYMLERLIMTVKEPSIIIFEKRGQKEDTLLWNSLKRLFIEGTSPYILPDEFMDRIDNIGWHAKHGNQGNVVAGLEIADLCAYTVGANYLRGHCRFYDICEMKLLGYPNRIFGQGLKIFP